MTRSVSNLRMKGSKSKIVSIIGYRRNHNIARQSGNQTSNKIASYVVIEC